MSLTKRQRNRLLEWAAEGLRLPEINARAAKEDAPFEVEFHHLRAARRSSTRKYRELKEQFELESLQEGLARRAVRLAAKMERHDLLRQVIEERGGDEHMQEIAGGKTGVLVREYRGTDSLPVYKVDAALLKELRDLEREIAIELGQWTEKKELSGPEGGAIPITITDLVGKIYDGEEEPAATNKE